MSTLLIVELAPKVDFGDIIREAAKGPLGIVALVVIILSAIGYFFFRKESVKVRLIIFGALSFGIALLVVACLRQYSRQQAPLVASQSKTPPTQAPCITGSASAKGNNSNAISGSGNVVTSEPQKANKEKATSTAPHPKELSPQQPCNTGNASTTGDNSNAISGSGNVVTSEPQQANKQKATN